MKRLARKGRGRQPNGDPRTTNLVLFLACLFAATLARQCFLYTLFLARLQVKGMPLDLLNYVFLLHLAFEAPQCVLKGFALLNSNLRQKPHTPKPILFGPCSYYKLLPDSPELYDCNAGKYQHLTDPRRFRTSSPGSDVYPQRELYLSLGGSVSTCRTPMMSG